MKRLIKAIWHVIFQNAGQVYNKKAQLCPLNGIVSFDTACQGLYLPAFLKTIATCKLSGSGSCSC